jgi:pyridoxamine 5'-phosphate oxidase
MKDLSDYRKSYEKAALLESTIPKTPLELFQKWFQEEDADSEGEVNAMTVASIGADGFPRSRVVLLKEYNDQGFVFYTNYESEKGKSITSNPHICLSFFWQKNERQVIIKGIAKKTSDATSDAYFESRPTGSQLGALVSNQSSIIASREVLEEKLTQLELEYQHKKIPRPKHWGGFIVKPIEIEFWQGRKNRLHDRIRYQETADFEWKIERLSP